MEPRLRVQLSFPNYKSGASGHNAYRAKLGGQGANRTLIGRLPCACSTTELRDLEHRLGFEPSYQTYEACASPSMLAVQNSWSGWPVHDPASLVWKTKALPLDDTRPYNKTAYSYVKDQKDGRGIRNQTEPTGAQNLDAITTPYPEKATRKSKRAEIFRSRPGWYCKSAVYFNRTPDHVRALSAY